MAVRPTGERVFGYRVKALQATHTHVSDAFGRSADFHTDSAQEQSGCGWSGFVLCGTFHDRKDFKIYIWGTLRCYLPAPQPRTCKAQKYVILGSLREQASPWMFQNHATARSSSPLLSSLLADFVPLQGTRVLQDREIRLNSCYVTQDAPKRWASVSVIKYTGAGSAPQWMDTEPGSVFGSNNITQGIQVKQTSLGHCALYT